MRNWIFAALLAGGVSSPVLAQEAGPKTGFRVEAVAGYDRPRAGGGSVDGAVYGGGAGYDYQAGNVISGVEVEFTESTVDETINDFPEDGDSVTATFGRDLYAGFRIGGVIGGTALIYAKAGYTNLRIGAEVDTADVSARGKESLNGIRAGAGVEIGIGTNLFVKGEYRYSNYEQGFTRHQAVGGVGFRF